MSVLEQRIGFMLAESAVDCTGLWQVTHAAEAAAAELPGETRMDLTLALVAVMLGRGFQVVEPLPDGGHAPWPIQAPEYVLGIIAEDWTLWGEPLTCMKYWFHHPEVEVGRRH